MRPDFFEPEIADAMVARIGALTAETEPVWGQMSVAQMLAHCSRPFESVYDPEYAKAHPPPNFVVRTLLRLLVKPLVVGEKPYKRSMRTAPEFVIGEGRDFATEQQRLMAFVKRAQEEGEAAFEGRESHSFGPLTAREWSTLFHKHTDHHLTQFGV
ncbi:MAG: DUF1569 domain-containing protein [Gemmatimonadetes bacterium]|nr:DUF1569 domain-containing protein [Gemmatimonadota bacterium]